MDVGGFKSRRNRTGEPSVTFCERGGANDTKLAPTCQQVTKEMPSIFSPVDLNLHNGQEIGINKRVYADSYTVSACPLIRPRGSSFNRCFRQQIHGEQGTLFSIF